MTSSLMSSTTSKHPVINNNQSDEAEVILCFLHGEVQTVLAPCYRSKDGDHFTCCFVGLLRWTIWLSVVTDSPLEPHVDIRVIAFFVSFFHLWKFV